MGCFMNNDMWTDGDKKFLQVLVQHKVISEDDLLNELNKWVLQRGEKGVTRNELKEYFTCRVAKYKEKLEVLGLTLNSIWVQEEDTFYWSIVNTQDDMVAQKMNKYSDTDIVVLRTVVDSFLEKEENPTEEQLDKRELLSLLDRKLKPMEVDSALDKLTKDQWLWLKTDSKSHRVHIRLSPRTILELPHVFHWYLSHKDSIN
ncbi:uncharacterized protein Gasu_21830 [Galdieria sulphuraria]|uniref:Non-structural maintenance of chromosomes element 1 homolog n=1 Tax=Galdieria sulphuraria TaxID=130081 RepID=M2W435_GALSU|nr:uncharacterized protein Gasu_21830 [Galdieria sulphuraria]EME30511.1 hypothetical protein Gasu_21830 [Galdieria sulphuraria]|eukprot:XP_005707031.1 hypothetical protein Gasu_21830 [Galdieria sulphuraria]